MTKSSLLFIMFHIVNKDGVAVIICCISHYYCSKKNYESRCIVIKSVVLNRVNKNAAKYTISFLTLGYILYSSIPITGNMRETFRSLDKAIVGSEVHESRYKDNCDSVIEKIKEDIKYQKSQKSQVQKSLPKNNRIDEVSKKTKPEPKNERMKEIVISPKIAKVQIAKNSPKQKSEGLVLTGYATAYTAKPSARMANGKKPIEGVHCAMHKKYKGRRVKVTIGNDVRYYDVDDTGPLKNGVIIDIYMNDRQRCLNFGKRKVKVEFVAR